MCEGDPKVKLELYKIINSEMEAAVLERSFYVIGFQIVRDTIALTSFKLAVNFMNTWNKEQITTKIYILPRAKQLMSKKGL